MKWIDLKIEIAAGRPVIVWVVGRCGLVLLKRLPGKEEVAEATVYVSSEIMMPFIVAEVAPRVPARLYQRGIRCKR